MQKPVIAHDASGPLRKGRSRRTRDRMSPRLSKSRARQLRLRISSSGFSSSKRGRSKPGCLSMEVRTVCEQVSNLMRERKSGYSSRMSLASGLKGHTCSSVSYLRLTSDASPKWTPSPDTPSRRSGIKMNSRLDCLTVPSGCVSMLSFPLELGQYTGRVPDPVQPFSACRSHRRCLVNWHRLGLVDLPGILAGSLYETN